MVETIQITKEDTNAEVVARILKAASKKYDCNLKIDFKNGKRQVEFNGDEAYKPLIMEDVQRIFGKANDN
ncbi:MAG: hypothetical protein GY859_04890 [Desulfobacterales bacterium]|nr:hypothetical protein [Desulfobacterales bacterium]